VVPSQEDHFRATHEAKIGIRPDKVSRWKWHSSTTHSVRRVVPVRMEGRKDKRTDGQKDERTKGRKDERTKGRKNEGRKDERTKGRKDERTKGRKDERKGRGGGGKWGM
jgi:hypothetical protein